MFVLPEDVRIRFALNGPIRTNLFLDPRKLIDQDRRGRLLPELEKNLGWNGKWQWACCPDGQRTSGLDRDTDTRRGTTIKPPYVVESLIMDKDYLEEIKQTLLKQAGESVTERIGEVSLQKIRVHFFDFGYATFWADFHLSRKPASDLTLDGLREGIEALAGKIKEIGPIFDCMRDQLESAASLPDHEDGDLIKGRTSEKIRMKATGVTWVHRVFGLQFSDPGALARACDNISDLIFTSSQEDLHRDRESVHEHSHIYVSTGNSASLFSGTEEGGSWDSFFTLSEMIQMQNAFFAAAEDLEDDLFLMTSNVSLGKDRISEKTGLLRKKKSNSNKGIDDFSRDIVVLLEEGILFKSAFLDYGNHLNPQETEIWKRLGKRWGTQDKFAHIDEKSDSLRVVYDRIITIIDQKKSEFLNKFALGFTLMGGISVVVDVTSIIYDFRWPSAVSVFALFGAVLVYLRVSKRM